MEPREPDLIDKVFKDDDGEPLNGQYFLSVRNEKERFSTHTTEYNYYNGKIHGEQAIIYPDGLEETWENGVFIKINRPPYHLQ